MSESERINPEGDWSVPELLRHVYRQVTEMKAQIESIKNDRSLYDRIYKAEIKLVELTTELETEKNLLKAQMERIRVWVAIGGVAIAVCSFLLHIFSK